MAILKMFLVHQVMILISKNEPFNSIICFQFIIHQIMRCLQPSRRRMKLHGVHKQDVHFTVGYLILRFGFFREDTHMHLENIAMKRRVNPRAAANLVVQLFQFVCHCAVQCHAQLCRKEKMSF